MVSYSNSDFQIKHPTLHQWATKAGIHVAGDQQLAVIDRYGQYDCLKGPGQFRISPLTQRVRGFISIAPKYLSGPISNIHTKDSVLVAVTVSIAHALDPRKLPRDEAMKLVGWSDQFHDQFMLEQSQRALQAVVPKFASDEIAGLESLNSVEQEFRSMLSLLVLPFGINISLCQIREMNVPDVIRKRLETIAQRTATIRDMREHDQGEYERALRTETIEALPKMSVGRMYLNPSQLLSADSNNRKNTRYIAPPDPPQLPTPEEPNYVEGEVLSDDEPESRL